MRINESDIKRILMECMRRLQEGAGSGYEITISGLSVDAIRVTGLKDGHFHFIGRLKRKACGFEVEGYDYSFDSNGIEDGYGNVIDEFSEEEKYVDGGYLRGSIDADYTDGSAEYAKQYIMDCLEDFSISQMYGGGYVHSYLPQDGHMIFKDIDINNDGLYAYLDEIMIVAPNVANAINSGYDSIRNADSAEDEDEQ